MPHFETKIKKKMQKRKTFLDQQHEFQKSILFQTVIKILTIIKNGTRGVPFPNKRPKTLGNTHTGYHLLLHSESTHNNPGDHGGNHQNSNRI